MIQEVPTGEWGAFLERFGREHRAWLATIHVVDARGTVARSAPIALKSAAASADTATLEFLGDARSVCVHRPSNLRIQLTNIGVDQALEFDVPDGQFIRLAFRSTALPEQLDGLAPERWPAVLLSPHATGRGAGHGNPSRVLDREDIHPIHGLSDHPVGKRLCRKIQLRQGSVDTCPIA